MLARRRVRRSTSDSPRSERDGLATEAQRLRAQWLRQLHARGMLPQPVEVVELAHRLVEDVDDDVGVVHQYPLAAIHAFDRAGPMALLAHVHVDGLRDRL